MGDRTEDLSLFDPKNIEISVGLSDILHDDISKTISYVSAIGDVVNLGTYSNDPNEEIFELTSVTLSPTQLVIETDTIPASISIDLNDSPNTVTWPSMLGLGYHISNGEHKTIVFDNAITVTETETTVQFSLSERTPTQKHYSEANQWIFQDRTDTYTTGNAIDATRILSYKIGDDRLTLSDNTITIPPGKYYTEFWSGAYRADRLISKLQDIDNNMALVIGVGSRSDSVLNQRQAFGSGTFTLRKTTQVQLVQFCTLYDASQHNNYLYHMFADDGVETCVRGEVKLWLIDSIDAEYDDVLIQTTEAKTDQQLIYGSGINNPASFLQPVHQRWKSRWSSSLINSPHWTVEFDAAKEISGYVITTTNDDLATAITAGCPTSWTLQGRNNVKLLTDSNVTLVSSSENVSFPISSAFAPMSSNGAWRSDGPPNQWFTLELPAPISINAYSIINETTAGNVQSPRSWFFSGSTNGVDWTTLDVVFDNDSNISGEVRYYDLPETYDEYRFFKFEVIDVNEGGDGYVSVGRFQLHQLTSWTALQVTDHSGIGINMDKSFYGLGPWSYTDYRFQFTDSSTTSVDAMEVVISNLRLLSNN